MLFFGFGLEGRQAEPKTNYINEQKKKNWLGMGCVMEPGYTKWP